LNYDGILDYLDFEESMKNKEFKLKLRNKLDYIGLEVKE
jgi:hypothetical protein